MTKDEKIAKLKEAGLDDSAIEAIMSVEPSGELEVLKAKIAEAEGKANGILGDKKKAQQKAEELQAKLDELEGNGLGEAEKLKLEVERMKSKLEKAEADKAAIEGNYTAEKRNATLAQIAAKMKFLDTVPEDMRSLIVSNELNDLEDLGNTVLVDERLKSVSTKYAGLLAADVPNGAGSKANGNNGDGGTNAPIVEKMDSMSDADIVKNAQALVQSAHESEQ